MSNIDWECADCGIVYCAPPDAGRQILDTDRYSGRSLGDLPEYCPDCGDHTGWKRAMSDDITAIIAGTLTTVWVYVIFSLAPLVVIAKGAIAFLTVVVIASLLYAAYYRYA